MKNRNIILFFVPMMLLACKKPYTPQVISTPNSYLVVEGVINVTDTTSIKLSKTVKLTSTITDNPVSGAEVHIEDDKGDSYALTESATPGTYKFGGVTLDQNNKYRLRIVTGGEVYLSDLEPVKVTPPVDSIGYNVVNNGLSLYVNSHDPANNTHYYRFDYAETWKFHSNYYSEYISNGTSIVPRTASQQVYFCFANNKSTTILLGSTAKLSQDVLSELPVTQIDGSSEKLEIKYSILLKEYALSTDAYKFWNNLKKNTEQLGSIFDAEPSEIAGNIHNMTKPADIAIGYISVGTVSQKRIFISSEQLPQSFSPRSPIECTADSVLFYNAKTKSDDVARLLIPGVLIPINAIANGYMASTSDCVDCTTRGFVKQPDFWQ